MEYQNNWVNVSNIDENEGTYLNEQDSIVNSGELHHKINMSAKKFYRECEDNNIPVFVSYYLPGKGYQYKAKFPEEIATPEVQSEYGKFKEFLKVCIGFNKEDYFPHIH